MARQARWPVRLLDACRRRLRTDDVEALELGLDPRPPLAAGPFGNPDQSGASEQTTTWARIRCSSRRKDGAHGERCLPVAEGALRFAQALVGERDLLRGEIGVGGVEQVRAV